MTTQNIVIVALVSGTCWTILVTRSIAHAANRVIERMDALGKTLNNIESGKR